MKKISVYIPTLNSEKYIESCIKSLLNQTYLPDEIAIVDSGSKDRTLEIVSKYPVKIIIAEDRGLAAARNIAIKEAKNDLIASIDSDCVASPNWLENLMKAFDGERIAGVGGKLVEINDRKIADFWRSIHMRQHWGRRGLINPEFLFGSNSLYNKKAIESVGFFNEKYKTNYEDVDISIRLKNMGYTLKYEPSSIVKHLRRDDVRSVLRASWRWTFYGFREPNSLGNFLLRILFNLNKSAKYFVRDLKNKRLRLIPIDLMIFFSHMIFDLKYYRNRRV
jgi:GT2 family glycosyltransferase